MSTGLPNGLEHEARKSEVLFSTEHKQSKNSFSQASPSQQSKKITYLGVSLSPSGVTDSMMMDRIHKATDDLVLARHIKYDYCIRDRYPEGAWLATLPVVAHVALPSPMCP